MWFLLGGEIMARQFVVISIVLLISVIINVAFVFEKIAGNVPVASESETPIATQRGANSRFENRVDLLSDFIVELTALKNIATKEKAENTIKATEKLLTIKQSQISVFDTDKAQKPRGRD